MIPIAVFLFASTFAEIVFGQVQNSQVLMKKCLKDRADQRKNVLIGCMESSKCMNFISNTGKRANGLKNCVSQFHDNLFALGEHANNCTFGNNKIYQTTIQGAQIVPNNLKLKAGFRGRRQAPPKGPPPTNNKIEFGHGGPASGGPAPGGSEDHKDENILDFMSRSPNPHLNSYHECIWKCAEDRVESQDLMKAPKAQTPGRRKRSSEVINNDVEHCCAKTGRQLNSHAYLNVTLSCSSSPEYSKLWLNVLDKACTCLYTALETKELPYPCDDLISINSV